MDIITPAAMIKYQRNTMEKQKISKFVVGDTVLFSNKLYIIKEVQYEEITKKFLYDLESVIVGGENIWAVYESWLQPTTLETIVPTPQPKSGDRA